MVFKFLTFKKEFPLLLNKKWEFKWELYVGIVDKYNPRLLIIDNWIRCGSAQIV